MSERFGDLAHRGEAVLDEISRHITLRTRLRRLRSTALPIVQTALAAGLAWWIANDLLHHGSPFFAPIAAVISLGVAYGQRLRRAVELVLGVTLGVLLSDAIIAVIGTGLVQIAVVVGLAVAAATFLGGGPLVINQAAASAVLVATLTPPQPGHFLSSTRPLDTLIGGLVGVVTNIVLLPVNPLTVAKRTIDPLLGELADTLTDLGVALARADPALVSAAQGRAGGLQQHVDALHSALAGSDEVARMAPLRWRVRDALGQYLEAAEPLDVASRNVRVLARTEVAVVRVREHIPAGLPAAVTGLGDAARMLRRELAAASDPVKTRRLAVSSARAAMDARAGGIGFYAQSLVHNIRSVSVDLLVATGTSREKAIAAMPAPQD